MRNIKLKIQYDGTDYHGWQIQKRISEHLKSIYANLMFNTKSDFQVASACRQKCLHAGRGRENSSDFAKMNSSAYVCTLEFIFAKSAQASYMLAC